MGRENEATKQRLEFDYTAESIASAFMSNRRIQEIGAQVEGKTLEHGILVTARPKEISPENEQNPVFVLLPGIRNHPREGNQFIHEMLEHGKTPKVEILHFPYDKDLEMELFLREIHTIIQNNDQVVIAGLCLGASMAVELINRLSDDERAKIKGLLLMSPTISNELKFMPPPVKRILAIVKDSFLITSSEKLLSGLRSLAKKRPLPTLGRTMADGLPPHAISNSTRILDIEAHLESLQPEGKIHEGIKIPNVTITWVSDKEEYMPPAQIDHVTSRIAQLAVPQTLKTVNNLPGKHGNVNYFANARAYRKTLSEWYDQVTGTIPSAA